MVDGDLDFTRMPTATEGEYESPSNLGRQYVHQSTAILIAYAE
jgi:hypothetical protein